MHVSVPAVLQDSRVAPVQIAERFRAHGQPIPPWIQGAIRRPVVDRFGVQGLADVQCDPEGCYESSTGAILSSMTYTPSGSSGSSGGTDWTSVLNTVAKGSLTLGQELALQPGVSISSSGAMSQQNPGYPIGTGVATAISGISSTTLLMIAGLAVLVLFAGKGK